MWALVPIVRRPALRGAYVLRVIGRMKPGVTLERRAADMAAVADGLAREFPKTNTGRGVDARAAAQRRDRQRAAADVAALPRRRRFRPADLLRERREPAARARHGADARAGDPRGAGREPATRRPPAGDREPDALGHWRRAGRRRRRGDSERCAVGDSGRTAARRGHARRSTLRVVAFCAAAALVVGVLFGIAPAWQATRCLVGRTAMTSDTRTTTGRGGLRACSSSAKWRRRCVLLFGAGLLLRTLLAVESVDRGYRAERVLTMLVDPLRLEAIRRPRRCCSSTRPSNRRSRRSRRARRGLGHHAAARRVRTPGDLRSRSSASPVAVESQRPTADYQIVSPDVLSNAGSAAGRRPRRSTIATRATNVAGVHRQRGVRARHLRAARRSACVSRLRSDGRTAGSAGGAGDRRRGAPGEGPARRTEDLVQVYVPIAQNLIDDIFLLVRPRVGPRRGAHRRRCAPPSAASTRNSW